MTPEQIDNRIDIAAGTLMEMLHWDPENVKKKEQVKKYLKEFLLKDLI